MVLQKGIKMFVAIFRAQKDAEKAKNLTLSDNSTIQMQEAQLYNAVEAKYKMIRIWDIPLNTNQSEIKEAFTKYGEINTIRMNTIGMWQTTNIEFTNQQDYQTVSQKWAVPFKADLVRIFPFIRTNECKRERDRFTLKLTNLPPGTIGYDLNNIIKRSNAKTCYISRNRNYTRKQYAVLSFKDQEDQDQAFNVTHSLGNTELTWTTMDTKLCAICSQQDYLAAQCNIKKQTQERRQVRHQLADRHGHLYQKYKPAGTTAMRRFLANQQQFQGRSFTSVAANKFKSNRNPPPRITQ